MCGFDFPPPPHSIKPLLFLRDRLSLAGGGGGGRGGKEKRSFWGEERKRGALSLLTQSAEREERTIIQIQDSPVYIRLGG